MRCAFLFDASVVANYFFKDPETITTVSYLMSRRETHGDIFFIPSFCVAEVQNTFAKHHYRWNLIDAGTYKEIRDSFIDMVHNRKVFYSYDLNRYHNLNAEQIFKKEHTQNTEFSFIDDRKPQGRTIKEREADLYKLQDEMKGKNVPIAKCYLSGLDILLISMGMELRRFFGDKRTYIVTKDLRIHDTCKTATGYEFCNVIYPPQYKTEDDLKKKFKDV